MRATQWPGTVPRGMIGDVIQHPSVRHLSQENFNFWSVVGQEEDEEE